MAGKTYKIAYLGNFQPAHSTETHLAASFELAGHTVTRIQEGETLALSVPYAAKGHDLFCWTQTYGLAVTGGTIDERYEMLDMMASMRIPMIGLHLDKWWDLDREVQISTEPFFKGMDRIFTADGGNQERFQALNIRHSWFPPGVYEKEAVIGRPRREWRKNVAFVGSWRSYHEEWPHRMQLVDFLRRTYRRPGQFGLYPTGPAIRGQHLADLYASCKVYVGDSCMVSGPKMYHSDRIPETLGRGGFLLHPYVSGTDYIDGLHLRFFPLGDFAELKKLIDYYVNHDSERRLIAQQGRQHVLDNHIYTIRVKQVIRQLEEEGLL